MPAVNSTTITVCLGIAASYLIFSLFVQTVQEVYKYLTNSKGRAYGKALEDFVGPLARQLSAPGVLPGLRVRGPFQLIRLSPTGIGLPLNKAQLIAGLERTAAPTIRQALDALTFEAGLQNGKPGAPSPAFSVFLASLGHFVPANPTAQAVAVFLGTWCPGMIQLPSGAPVSGFGGIIDASKVLEAFRRKYLSHVEKVAAEFPQFASNFDHVYKRRNLRQTFVIAFAVAYVFQLPFQYIYDNARQMSPQQAESLANQAMTLFTNGAAVNFGSGLANGTGTNQPAASRPVSANLAPVSQGSGTPLNAFTNQAMVFATNEMQLAYVALQSISQNHILTPQWCPKKDLIKFVFGCLISALLVSFGAPLWNDVASYFLNAQKNAKVKSSVPSHPDYG